LILFLNENQQKASTLERFLLRTKSIKSEVAFPARSKREHPAMGI